MLRCAAGRFVQFPRQEQMFLAAGTQLRMQTADHFIAGFEVSTKAGTRIIVEGYRKDLGRPIGEAVNRYVELQERVTQFDQGAVRGAEITLQHQAPSAWSWEADYAWLQATQTKDGVDSPRNTDQRHNLGLSFGRRLGKGWQAGAIVRYASGVPYTPQEAGPMWNTWAASPKDTSIASSTAPAPSCGPLGACTKKSRSAGSRPAPATST